MGSEEAQVERERLRERLKSFREEAGLEQMPAAILSGVPLGTIQNWESGKSKPDSTKLRPLAETYGCEVGDFYGEANPTVDQKRMRRVMRLTVHPMAGLDEAGVRSLRRSMDELLEAHFRRMQRRPTGGGVTQAAQTPPSSRTRRR